MKNILLLILSIAVTSLISGCKAAGTTPGGEENKYTVDSGLIGMWYRLDADETINLGQKTNLVIEQVDTNLIEITDSNESYYAIRNGSSDTSSLTLKIGALGSETLKSGTVTKGSGLTNIGGISVIIRGINNGVEEEAITDVNGQIQVNNLPPDTYTVSAGDGTATGTTEIKVAGSVDAGIITPVTDDLYNFKTRYTTFDDSEQSNWPTLNQAEYYGDNLTHNFQLYIKNTGKANLVGASYTLSTTDPIVSIQSSLTGVTGSIVKGDEKTIQLQFKTKAFIEAGMYDLYHDAKINIKIKDVYNNVWNDYVILRIYRNSIDLILPSSQLKYSAYGFLIYPDKTVKRFGYDEPAINSIPYDPSFSYKVLLACRDAADETSYKIYVNANSPTDGVSVDDTAAYEPNNTEATAKTINLKEAITSYLHMGDLDYFNIDISDKSKIYTPVDLDYVSYSFKQYTGNNDTTLNAGESHYIDIQLNNPEIYSSAGFIQTTISSADSYVTINTSTNSFTEAGALQPGVSGWSGGTTAFAYTTDNGRYSRITIAPGCPDGHVANFTLTIKQTDFESSISTTTTRNFSITVQHLDANIEFDVMSNLHQSTAPGGGDGDGDIEYNEYWFFDIQLKNTGTVQTDGVKVTLSTTPTNSNISIFYPGSLDYGSYGTILAGSTGLVASYSFRSVLNTTRTVEFNVTVTDKYGNTYTKNNAFSVLFKSI